MKNFPVVILFMFIVIPSLGQSKSNDYILTLNFAPSFMSASELSVQAKVDSCFLNIRIYKNYQTKETSIESKAITSSSKLTTLTNFLKTYKFQIKNNIDTVGSHKVFVHGDSVVVYNISAGLDGINVNGYFSQHNLMNRFAFWSPNKGTTNAEFMDILFDLIDKVFTDQNAVNYIEQLQQYFPHHLGLKMLSDDPLTYKLFGSISQNEEDELYNFLKNLPLQRKVIIDMSNYSGMGTMFYDVFNEYCVKNRNIYWLNPTFRGLIDLYKIGIPNNQVISKKKIVKIIKKKGSEVISSEDD